MSGEAGVWLGLVEMGSAVAYQLFQSSSFVALGGRGTLPGGGGVNKTIGTYLPEVDFPPSRSTVYFREGEGGGSLSTAQRHISTALTRHWT